MKVPRALPLILLALIFFAIGWVAVGLLKERQGGVIVRQRPPDLSVPY